jgi:hypothetical protein
MAIREVLMAPTSPWQTPDVERLIGSIRRECLDHLMVFNESSPRRTLKSYFDYYHGARTHLSLEKDKPFPSSHRHQNRSPRSLLNSLDPLTPWVNKPLLVVD